MNTALTPFFTIITATYNAAETLPRLLQSLAEQSCQDFVWVCQDGASNDATMAIVEQWKDKLPMSIKSCQDSGIYDAWNKAITREGDKLGEWVLFLGADDQLASSDVLQKVKNILSAAPEDISLAAGDILFTEEDTLTYEKRFVQLDTSFAQRFKGTPLPHSALFAHRRTFKKNLFDTKFKIVSDWDWIIKTWQKQEQAIALSLFITIMARGGISDREETLPTICNENLRIMWRHQPKQFFPCLKHFIFMLNFSKFYCKILLKHFLLKRKNTQWIWKYLQNLKKYLFKK